MKFLLLLGLLGVSVASGQDASFSDGFALPSGRIQCQFSDEKTPPALSCEVQLAQFRPPTRPADCPLAWGDSLGLGVTGKAYFVCHGDTVFDPLRPALAYGNTWRTPGLTPNGRIICQSRPSGLRCTNADGHGFELARAYYRLF
ncbi:hypothetical protein FNU79_15920 [Deinococcus detaillensis]|uniref:Ig-like domain-containing protein n=1 Tax=Deinococcus detaillensis TaxID=2592048 RepID=A0A553UKU8_9DEIO|nr:DUF6636 domain-containing protein [Deinococcus detaillensis]TSA80820.1 hypothetical protein FNU79_15920 [Deinococcus detaillensis]